MNEAIVSKPKQKIKLTKKKMIEDHLKSGKSLTQWECTMLYRHLRLGAVIYDLRNEGWVLPQLWKRMRMIMAHTLDMY